MNDEGPILHAVLMRVARARVGTGGRIMEAFTCVGILASVLVGINMYLCMRLCVQGIDQSVVARVW